MNRTPNTPANGGQILTYHERIAADPNFIGVRSKEHMFDYLLAEIRDLRASLAAPAIPTVDRNAQEDVAKAIYRLFDGAEAHPWRNGGNSNKQDEARRYARAAISAAQPAAQVALSELQLTSWTDLENYGEKFCEGFNAGVKACIAALATPATVKTAEGL